MRKLNYYLAASVLSGVFIISCDTPQAEAVKTEITNPSAQSLSRHGIPASIVLPADLLGNHALSVLKQPGSGQTNLTLGEDFKLFMRRENTNLEDFRNDLVADAVFKYDFLPSEEGVLFAKSMLPDGSPFSHRIIAQKDLGGGQWIIQSDPTASISSLQAKRLVEAINSITSESGLTAELK